MNKKKSKKDKKPNIPVQTLARPRLEQLMTRRQHGELDDEAYVASIEKLMAELGQEAVLNALTGLLDTAKNEQRDALMVAISKLGNAETIECLWRLVRRSKASLATKMTTLVILKQMGEEVNLEDPGEYFSWRDIKHADIAEVKDMARFGTRAIIKALQKVENADEAEIMMMQHEEIIAQTGGGETTLISMIEDLVTMADSGAADMLLAISATTSHPKARESARKGLLKLAGQKVFPQSEIIKSLTTERFYAAYSTDPAHPWQQGVAIAFERSKNMIQALVFLLDFGSPWKGAIKDFFPTQIMTPQQFQRDFIKKSGRYSEAQYLQTTYARARQFILNAVEANQRQRVKLPPEYHKFHHWIERRIVDPSPEVLAYAAQVDANTVDEWPTLTGEPVRGMEIIGPHGEPISVMTTDDLPDEEWDELDELLSEVDEYYYGEEGEEIEEDEEIDEAFILPYDWAIDYLTARYEEGVDIEELDERWLDLADFMYYADADEDTPPALADIQGYHLSRFVIGFWDEELDAENPLEEKQHAVETIRDLYAYLADQEHIPAEVAARVAQAAKTLLSQPETLTPIAK